MQELLPIVLGFAFGAGFSWVVLPRRVWLSVPLAALIAGTAASAMNGELTHELWVVFLSFDAVLAGLGAIIGCLVAIRLRGLARSDAPLRN